MNEEQVPVGTRVKITTSQSFNRRTKVEEIATFHNGGVAYIMEDGGMFSRDEFDVEDSYNNQRRSKS